MQLNTKEHSPAPGKTKKVTPSSAKELPALDARSALRSSSQPSAASDPSDLPPSTPTRKRLEYPVDHSPTVREASGDLHHEFSVPVPEGVGLNPAQAPIREKMIFFNGSDLYVAVKIC